MKKEKNLIEEEGDLNKHSALTTYKVAEGKEFSLQVHKAVNAVYSKEQLILKENFRKETLEIIKEVYPEEEIENIMTYLYTNKSLEFKNKKINLEKLPKIVSDILKYRIEKINWELLDKKTKEDKFLELDSFPFIYMNF